MISNARELHPLKSARQWLLTLLSSIVLGCIPPSVGVVHAEALSGAGTAALLQDWPLPSPPVHFSQPRGNGKESSARSQPAVHAGRIAAAGAEPVRHITQLRQLSPEQAARRMPLRLSGIVTDFSGYKNSFYLEEGSASISVDRTDHAAVRVNDRVDLVGTSGPGLFAPVVLASEVRVTGHGPPPAARRVTFRQMMGGLQDSQWVEVQGVVHSAMHAKVFDIDVLVLGVEMDGSRVPILMHAFGGIDAERLIDATVQVRGVCASEFNQKRQFLGMEIDVPETSDLEILQPSAENAFSIPLTPIGNAFRLGSAQHRIRVAGTVTQETTGESLYLQEGSDGLRVQIASTDRVTPGTRVEAVGFPVMGEYSPMLADGVFRVLGEGRPVAPRPIEAREVLRQRDGFDDVPYGEQLVQLQGEVVESHIQSGQAVWTLRQGDQTFEGYMPRNAAGGKIDMIGRGSLVQLTGICTIAGNYERDPTSFAILMRSSQDIRVLRRASWWTPAHLFLLLSALLLVTLIIALWVVMLKERVNRQTRIIRESEGRFRYLADHDGLTGLPNRNAILAALAGELEQADRRATGVCVAIIDLDHFKHINDSLGHLAGDEVLRQAAQRFSSSIRTHDALGRYGGEEFLIVFSEVDGEMGVERCEAIRRALADIPIPYEGKSIQMTCSIGLSSMYGGRESTTALIAQADGALYQAKNAGRDRVECWLDCRPAGDSLNQPFEGLTPLRNWASDNAAP